MPDHTTQEKIAFTMKLLPGKAAEYERHHDAIWPELSALLREAGIRDYSIYLDAGSDTLFAVLWRRKDHGMGDLPQHPVMRKWWDHMADLMQVKPDHEPVTMPLRQVFHLD
ncbi:MAG TPA: L-rhamnose mutarotase [Terriglobales bacterium]|nr:L-rhamnose mutarotase [Terriglobales bacterium]